MLCLEHTCMCSHADKRGSMIVRGRAVDTGSQNGCRIISLNRHGQSLEEVHERALLAGGLPKAVAKVP